MIDAAPTSRRRSGTRTRGRAPGRSPRRVPVAPPSPNAAAEPRSWPDRALPKPSVSARRAARRLPRRPATVTRWYRLRTPATDSLPVDSPARRRPAEARTSKPFPTRRPADRVSRQQGAASSPGEDGRSTRPGHPMAGVDVDEVHVRHPGGSARRPGRCRRTGGRAGAPRLGEEVEGGRGVVEHHPGSRHLRSRLRLTQQSQPVAAAQDRPPRSMSP